MKNNQARKFKQKYKALRKTAVKVKNKKLKNLPKKVYDKELKPKTTKKNKQLNKSTYFECMEKVRGWVPTQNEEEFKESGFSNKELHGMQTFSNYDLEYLESLENLEDENEATKEPEAKKESEAKNGRKKKAATHSTAPLLPVWTDEGWDYPKPAPEENGKDAESTTSDLDEAGAQPPSHDKDDSLPDQRSDQLPSYDDSSLSHEAKKQMLLHLAYPSNTTKTIPQLWADHQKHILEKKNLMASLALNGIRKSIMSKNIRYLIKMMREASPESEVTIRRYCCLTLAQVFHDQIPGYRMQDEVPTLRLKKETYATVKMEVEFMTSYRIYLKSLEETLTSWKSNSNHLGLKLLSETALFCLGELLALHPHFNYSVNIVQLIVPYLNCKNAKIRAIVSNALARTFKVDRHNYLTLQIVRRIYRLAQRMHFNVKADLLQVFLHLPLNNMKNPDHVAEQDKTTTKTLDRQQKLIRKLAVKSHSLTSRKEKREHKRIAKLREAMSEVQANQEMARDTTRNSYILEKVFAIYFHLLKRKPSSVLIPHVLEGLSRYAHLISINYFSDILSVLNGFVAEKKLQKKELMFCIHTVFAILSGQGEDLAIDPHQIYCEFYSILLNLYPGEVCKHLALILNIIDQMLVSRKKKVSLKKVVAFTKRLTTLLITLPHQGAIPLLICITNLFKVFNCTKTLLQTEDAGSSGVFLPAIPDPDHSNSESGVVWELILSQRHYHPHVRMMSTAILIEPKPHVVRQIYQLTRKPTETLIEELDSSNLKFNPPIPIPSMHLIGKKKTKRKVFYRNQFILGDLKLQVLIDEVLDKDRCENPPPRKKFKILGKRDSRQNASDDDLIDSVDFFPQAPLNEDQIEAMNKDEEEMTKVQEEDINKDQKEVLKMQQKLLQSPSLDAEAEGATVKNSEQRNYLSYYI